MTLTLPVVNMRLVAARPSQWTSTLPAPSAAAGGDRARASRVIVAGAPASDHTRRVRMLISEVNVNLALGAVDGVNPRVAETDGGDISTGQCLRRAYGDYPS